MPALLAFWWTGWISFGLIGVVSVFVLRMPRTMGVILAANEIAIVGHLSMALTTGLFLTIVWRVTSAQQASRHQAQQVAEAFA